MSDDAEEIARIARTFLKDARSVLFLGRGAQRAVALEAARMFELATGRKAATDASIDPSVVITICPKDRHHEETIFELRDFLKRGIPIVTIATRGDAEAAALSDAVIFVSEADETVLPLLTIVPLRLLAGHFQVP